MRHMMFAFMLDTLVRPQCEVHARFANTHALKSSCVSIAEAKSNQNNNGSANSTNSTKEYQTHCLGNMYGPNLNELAEEFSENFNLMTGDQSAPRKSLNQTIPLVRYLQQEVFH